MPKLFGTPKKEASLPSKLRRRKSSFTRREHSSFKNSGVSEPHSPIPVTPVQQNFPHLLLWTLLTSTATASSAPSTKSSLFKANSELHSSIQRSRRFKADADFIRIVNPYDSSPGYPLYVANPSRSNAGICIKIHHPRSPTANSFPRTIAKRIHRLVP